MYMRDVFYKDIYSKATLCLNLRVEHEVQMSVSFGGQLAPAPAKLAKLDGRRFEFLTDFEMPRGPKTGRPEPPRAWLKGTIGVETTMINLNYDDGTHERYTTTEFARLRNLAVGDNASGVATSRFRWLF